MLLGLVYCRCMVVMLCNRVLLTSLPTSGSIKSRSELEINTVGAFTPWESVSAENESLNYCFIHGLD